MSRMTRRTVPSRKPRTVTRVSRLAPYSLVVLINMSDTGERWVGRRLPGVYARHLGLTYFWAFPTNVLGGFRRGPSWLLPRTRG